jgi:diaminohydroxyphosphoribosylaminopyrimidine deaminase/5-amino-6-(5-phosphoribosylamino)uracil reductase
MVGAVVVHEGVPVGQGWHERVGGHHAEVNALNEAGDRAKGAVLYVTLEPCNHQGRTPPCTRAVVEAGISRVVVGMADPNPHVQGGGAQFLRNCGIQVDAGVLEQDCRSLNQSFIKHALTGRPYVTLKAASTLDGRTATPAGDSRWITNERSRKFVHHLRCVKDGILIGIDTALADDPSLTARIRKVPACRQPVRIILDTLLRLPTDGQLVKTARDVPVWAACAETAPREREAALEDSGVMVLRLPAEDRHLSIPALLQELGKLHLTSLLVEGGSKIMGAFVDGGAADDFHFFYAPKILGDTMGIPMIRGRTRERMADALPVYDLRVKRFGQDVMLSGRFHQELY